MRLTLVILMAGRSTRFGRPKPLEPVGPSGEALFEYAAYDGIRAGASRIVFVTRPDTEALYRAQAKARLGTSVPVDVVTQRIDDVPAGFRPPAGRERPWGTAHAVLSLRDAVREPFLVLNADDFYGPAAIPRLRRRLRDARTTGDPSHFLAGYELQDTPLSESGGVNRAICQVDSALFLERIEEVFRIRRQNGRYVGESADGSSMVLRPEIFCSMNLWGFQATIFERLWPAFERFHARLDDPDRDEFRLSTAIGGLVSTGRVRVRVVPTDERAFGMTFAEDVAAVSSGVAQSVASGHYPTDLGEWFDRRRGRTPG